TNPMTMAARATEGVRAVVETLGASFWPASPTPFNRAIGPHRRFDWTMMELGAVKAVKDRLGGTVNDVVLATVAGALRRFLERRRINPDMLDIRANVPVSLRTAAEPGTLGNRLALFSYAGRLCWGCICDWDLVPDLHDFVGDIEASFAELEHAAGLVALRAASSSM